MTTQILQGFNATEKTAYVTAIASIATADQSASELELDYLKNLAQAAGLSEEEIQQVSAAAAEANGQSLKNALDILKSSELKYSLVTDLMAFAQSDKNVAEQEKTHIAAIASYLQIDATQLQALNEFVQQTAAQPAAMALSGEMAPSGGLEGILGNFGLGDKLKNSGINIGNLATGLMSFVGPMIMGNLLNKGLQGSNASGGLNQGGLGSLISGLSGGKNSSGGIGGFLSNLLK